VTPRIIVLSAPSGAGKTTIAKALRDRFPDRFGFSVSATTRKPRSGEKDGIDYYFWTPAQFLKGVNEGKFLEHAEYGGELYGTLRSDVQRILDAGRHVLLDIEVQGAEQVIRLDTNALTIFILPSDPQVLIQRLVKRGSETAQQIDGRLERATYEIGKATQFHRWIRNDDLDEAVDAVMKAIENPGKVVRERHDISWLNSYLNQLKEEKTRIWDTLHQQKG
jgi:guanylate kinase